MKTMLRNWPRQHTKNGLSRIGDVLECVLGYWRSDHSQLPRMQQIEPARHRAFSGHVNGGVLALDRLRLAVPGSDRVRTACGLYDELQIAVDFWDL